MAAQFRTVFFELGSVPVEDVEKELQEFSTNLDIEAGIVQVHKDTVDNLCLALQMLGCKVLEIINTKTFGKLPVAA